MVSSVAHTLNTKFYVKTDILVLPYLGYPGQSTVTKQYKFGTSASWEGSRSSGVALAMRHRQ